MSNTETPFQVLKRLMVRVVGRERANKIGGPYYDWRAGLRTKRFLAHLPQRDLCVNLGCGYRPMKGWINVDRARGAEVQVVWDLRKGLPFQDGSCSAIFSEHMIEHITTDDADKLLGECHRVLAAGGVLRLSTPDAGRFLRSYAGDREFLNNSPFAQPVETPMDRINQMMREDSQHLWTYDADSLLLRLRKAGFAQVKEQKFGESLHTRMHNIDSAERAFESLYVEAIR